jgi:DNA-binding LacI/PurR family transcriptional regulator
VDVIGEAHAVPLIGLVSPPLTTVAQAKVRVGRAGVDLLVETIDEGQRPTSSQARRVLPTQLIVRGSTGPAPRGPGSQGRADEPSRALPGESSVLHS